MCGSLFGTLLFCDQASDTEEKRETFSKRSVLGCRDQIKIEDIAYCFVDVYDGLMTKAEAGAVVAPP
jgi:hypothetical protein